MPEDAYPLGSPGEPNRSDELKIGDIDFSDAQ